MTNIPKSPLEVSHIIETQRLETELVCSSSIECEDCGAITTDWHTCPRCTRKICVKHIDTVRGICSACKAHLDTENQEYHSEIKLAEELRLAEIERNAEPKA